MKHLIFPILISILFLSSCKEDNGSLTINFKPGYGGQPLVLFQAQDFSDNTDIRFSAISFFLSDVELVNSDGTTTPLNEIDLIDVGATTQIAAEEGTSLEFNEIKPGSYSMLRFKIGVPSDLNQMKPSDFGANDALSNTAFYWDNWQSYIFSKTEGMMDTLKNGTYDYGWLVHTGKSSMIQTLNTPGTVSITENGNTKLEFFIDFKELLKESNGEPFNLKEKPINHQQNDTMRIRQYVNNYPKAISVIQ